MSPTLPDRPRRGAPQRAGRCAVRQLSLIGDDFEPSLDPGLHAAAGRLAAQHAPAAVRASLADAVARLRFSLPCGA